MAVAVPALRHGDAANRTSSAFLPPPSETRAPLPPSCVRRPLSLPSPGQYLTLGNEFEPWEQLKVTPTLLLLSDQSQTFCLKVKYLWPLSAVISEILHLPSFRSSKCYWS